MDLYVLILQCPETGNSVSITTADPDLIKKLKQDLSSYTIVYEG